METQKICDINEYKIQEFIFRLFNNRGLDNIGGLTVKTIRDINFCIKTYIKFCVQIKNNRCFELGFN